MGLYVQNTGINCTACGNGPFRGREQETKRKDGSIIVECRWTCPRCLRLVRKDEKIIPAK